MNRARLAREYVERLPIAAYRQENRFVLWNMIEDWWRRLRGRPERIVRRARKTEFAGEDLSA
jgi:hypothetical protein